MGGLWISIILHPNLNPQDSWVLQFLVANSIRSSIETNTGIKTSMKWPNDIVSNGAKLGGILVETKTSADRLSYAIIGIGINVNLTAKQLPEGATTIRDLLGKRISLNELAHHLIADLQTRYKQGLDSKPIIDEWWTNCSHRGRQVRVETVDTVIEGVNIGINNRGHLILQTPTSDSLPVVDGQLRIMNSAIPRKKDEMKK
jgi:BirA family biotin operon repressor/biotin-[acetyl-CoA-carboxylase] ligase